MNTLPHHPSRRTLLAGLAGTLLPPPSIAAAPPPATRARPGTPSWPKPQDWAALAQETGGRTFPVTRPSIAPAQAASRLSNPYFLRDEAALTQSSGCLDGWRSTPSAYAVRAGSAADISAAIRFATRHNVALVVKGGGHSYLGGSNAPDSLLVWTRDMEDITLHDAFVPQDTVAAPVPAVTLGAGCIWGQAYQAVTTQAGRYVQGGGCLTVGVAGLVQGGGFGSFSKQFGLAAGSLLQAEIVTADARRRTVNASRDPDLFWALKGGGGGTYGVLTSLTLQTHTLPETFGLVTWTLRATSDDAFHRLLAAFLDTYATHLFNPNWGEQARVFRHNRFQIMMLFHGLTQPQAEACWQALRAFIAAHPQDYTTEEPFQTLAFPARRMWDHAFLRAHLPTATTADDRPDARPADWWWTGNTEEAGTFWHGYTSAWLPAVLLQPARQARLADAWFAASRHWSIELHFNKGLAGAAGPARAASAATAMNPQVLDAFALAIIAMDGPSAFPGLPPPDLALARDHARQIHAAMAALRAAAPDAGSYLSESDYNAPDWKLAHWGEHVARLERVKLAYDPAGVFGVHHGIGSDRA